MASNEWNDGFRAGHRHAIDSAIGYVAILASLAIVAGGVWLIAWGAQTSEADASWYPYVRDCAKDDRLREVIGCCLADGKLTGAEINWIKAEEKGMAARQAMAALKK